MSATNKTTNYELPVFVGTDKPAWLTDFNGAMQTIDTAIKEAKTAGDNAQSTADTNTSNISTLDGSVSTLSTSVSTLSGTVTSQGGTINTITELLGNGEPTTQNKTIIGAINELDARTVDPDAEDVDYNNTTSGLTATNVQDAIDEVNAKVVTDADDINYDNTTSGLTATNVQDAIDELASASPAGADHGIYELWANSDITQAFAGQTVTISNFDSTKIDALVIPVEMSTGEADGAVWHEFDKAVLDISSYTGTMRETFLNDIDGNLYEVKREVTFSLTGTTLTITFGDGKVAGVGSLGTAPTYNTSNTNAIPVRILGIVHNA